MALDAGTLSTHGTALLQAGGGEFARESYLADHLPYFALADDDVLILTADHGNDPTTPSTDHSREYVPILISGKSIKKGVNLGVRETFADLAATLADLLGVKPPPYGTSFKPLIMA